jgi:hypothetical protein
MGSVDGAYAQRGVFEQPGDVGKSLDVDDARGVKIPAIGCDSPAKASFRLSWLLIPSGSFLPSRILRATFGG